MLFLSKRLHVHDDFIPLMVIGKWMLKKLSFFATENNFIKCLNKLKSGSACYFNFLNKNVLPSFFIKGLTLFMCYFIYEMPTTIVQSRPSISRNTHTLVVQGQVCVPS
jgi:hypothetical protein